MIQKLEYLGYVKLHSGLIITDGGSGLGGGGRGRRRGAVADQCRRGHRTLKAPRT